MSLVFLLSGVVQAQKGITPMARSTLIMALCLLVGTMYVKATCTLDPTDLCAGAVLSDKMGSSIFTTQKFKDNAITHTKLSAAAVTTDKLKAGAITMAKLSDQVRTLVKAAAHVGPTGPAGLPGATGPVGPKGSDGHDFNIHQRLGATGQTNEEYADCDADDEFTIGCICQCDGLNQSYRIENNRCICNLSACYGSPFYSKAIAICLEWGD